MNNKKNITNIAFIILICLLCISAVKAQKMPLNIFKDLTNIPVASNEQQETSGVVLKDFDEIKPPAKKSDDVIDLNTALQYMETRQLNGTEMLELSKIDLLGSYLSRRKIIVIYVNKGSDSNIQAFIKEFTKTREKYNSHPDLVFIPRELLWNIDDYTIQNTHDRVMKQIKKDCENFCILEVGQVNSLIKVKGSSASKKSAQIADALLRFITK